MCPQVAALVMGEEPVGLGCLQAWQAVGVSHLPAVDSEPERRDVAGRLGARALAGGDGVVEWVPALPPDGLPLVVKASGSPAAQRQALDQLASSG